MQAGTPTGEASPPPPSTKREPSARRTALANVELARRTSSAAPPVDPEADTVDAPPDADAAYLAGRQARREGKGAAENPHTGPNGNAIAARLGVWPS
jgi:hypothetical protein